MLYAYQLATSLNIIAGRQERLLWLLTGGNKVASNLCRFVRENPPELELHKWEFPKIRGTLFWVLIIRVLLFRAL